MHEKEEEKFFPRILIINGEPISTATATGITMRNLFERWPKEALATVHISNLSPDFSRCSRVWHLNRFDILGHSTGGEMEPAADGERNSQMRGTSARTGVISRFRRGSTVFLECCPFSLSSELQKWITALSPDVIYTLGANIRIMDLCVRIAIQYGIPILPHFMDDWPHTLYATMNYRIPHFLLQRKLRDMLEYSPFCMTISPEMSEAYQKRWGKSCYNFMNCVAEEPLAAISEKLSDPLRLFYIGGLHLNRWKTLGDIADQIQASFPLSRNYEMTIFVPRKDWEIYGRFLSEKKIRYGGELSFSQVFPMMKRADVLLHVESFEPKNHEFTKLSISTKLVQYFMAGRPVLGVGPEELASLREVRRSGGGIACNGDATDALRQLLEPNVRRKFGNNAYHYACDTHSSTVVCEDFRKRICRAVGAS